MSTARLQKKEDAEVLRQELAEVPNAILVDFKGLDVAGATDLRRKLREGDARFRVVKNSTALRAIEDLPLDDLSESFVGQTAIAFTDGDIVGVAKALREFATEHETPNFKAGIVDGVPISAEEFEQLAQLPPREELIGKALYLMNYPITGLVTALSGILKSAVVVLDQIRDKKEQAGEEAPAEVAEAAADDADTPAAEAADEPEQAAAEAEAAAADDGEPEAEAATADDGEAEAATADDGEPEAEAAAADDGEPEAEAAAADDGEAEVATADDGGAEAATGDDGDDGEDEEKEEE